MVKTCRLRYTCVACSNHVLDAIFHVFHHISVLRKENLMEYAVLFNSKAKEQMQKLSVSNKAIKLQNRQRKGKFRSHK